MKPCAACQKPVKLSIAHGCLPRCISAEEREWRKALLDALGTFFLAYRKKDSAVEKGWAFDLEDLRKRFL